MHINIKNSTPKERLQLLEALNSRSINCSSYLEEVLRNDDRFRHAFMVNDCDVLITDGGDTAWLLDIDFWSPRDYPKVPLSEFLVPVLDISEVL